jgi:hypothetical protein
MSTATKIVVATVSIAAVLGVALVANAYLAA